MGYSASSYLIWGYKLTEEESQRVVDQELYEVIDGYRVGQFTVESCGDARVGKHPDYVFGLIVGKGDEYNPSEVESIAPTEEQLNEFCALQHEHGFQDRVASLWLITYVA